MPEGKRNATADGLSDQERTFVQSRDPGASVLKDIKAAVVDLTYDKSAAKVLMDELLKERSFYSVTPPVTTFELPSDVEEVITFRSARFEVQLITGLHETDNEGYVSLVIIVFPLMGWEVMRLSEEIIASGKGPDWADGWTDDDIESFQIENDDAISEGRPQTRELVPIMAQAVDDPFDEVGYSHRREAMLGVIKLLCSRFPFKVHFTESGNIPKEVPDEWIAPSVLEEFKQRMALVDERLANAPQDPTLLLEKASLLMGRDELKTAEELLNAAVKVEPNLPFIWFALSDVYSRTGREDEADDAEARGAELEKILDGRWPARPDILDYTPPLKRFSEEVIEEDLKRKQPRCAFCGSNFLLVSDGFWAKCNQCNRTGPITGRGLGLSLTFENSRPFLGEPIMVKVTIENPTDLEMTYSTDGLEFISMPPTEEVTDDGEEDSIGDYILEWIGKLKAPSTTGIIPPHGTKVLSIDMRQLETLGPTEDGEDEHLEGLFDSPGEHRVSIYLKVIVGPIEEGREPWAQTDPIKLLVREKR